MTPLHHGQYVHLDVLPTGGLRITLTPEGVEELDDIGLETSTDDDAFYDLYVDDSNMGGPHGNSGPLLVMDISEVDGGHLSNAPAIVESWRCNDPEERDYVDEPGVNYLSDNDGRIWYWADYQIISILEHIKRQGEAVLTLLT